MNISTKALQHYDAVDAYPTRLPDRELISERTDPVLWSDWSEAAPISRDEADHYANNGYLVRHDMFSEDELDVLVDTAQRLRDTDPAQRPADFVTEPNSDDVRTVFRLDEHSPIFARLAADTRLAGVAEFLLNDRVYLHQSRLNYKPGFKGKEFYWHSDFETWHAEDGLPRMRAVSASVLLTDNSKLNGPLLLIPGSQNEFIACLGETPENNHESSLKAQEVGVPQPDTIRAFADTLGLDAAAGPTGTVVFFDCNTLHGSNGNITPDPRSNAFFVFNAITNRPVEPFAAPEPRPAWLANRDRIRAIDPVEGRIARG
ncbi:ectoine hydroxylase [Maritimibacter sp. UBA3975]|uniref:ectoine hydroxylase n=1 Tax=Maritimibacter sp. UBA3975 TaxID=1946833 RepID=UPI000C0969F2|nr:ectoine hydroxylase [Maritimibacter sp. UBA3975]MAM62497.1 ectoine hydroxylase [Maritimibacter sp.]|tara:strand:- start:8207 stop:9154 length:948 start_codon:yes stop_codon:yes gene_type:complete